MPNLEPSSFLWGKMRAALLPAFSAYFQKKYPDEKDSQETKNLTSLLRSGMFKYRLVTTFEILIWKLRTPSLQARACSCDITWLVSY